MLEVISAAGYVQNRAELCTCFTSDAGAAVCRDKKLEACEVDTVHTALCEAHPSPNRAAPPRSSKRTRYCFTGVHATCERTTCVEVPVRQCHNDPEICETHRKSHKESAKQVPVEAACATIPPPRIHPGK